MAIRVQTQDAIIFGIVTAAVAATHVRFRRGSDDGQPVVKALPATVNAAANEGLRLPSGMLDVVYPAGDLGNTHMRVVVEGYWGASGSRTEMEIDLMTSSSQVVSASGYSQQSYDNWAVSEESD